MTKHRFFTLSNSKQQGEINIYYLQKGLEIKTTQLHTFTEYNDSGCFEPDIRLVFSLEGRTHLQFGQQAIQLQAGSMQEAVLLPLNQPELGSKIFHIGKQNELVLFFSSVYLEMFDCPLYVIKILRSSHLQPYYFKLTPDMKRLISNIIHCKQAEHWQAFYQHTQSMMLVTHVLQHLFPTQPDKHQNTNHLNNKRLERLVSLLHNANFQAATLKDLAQYCHSNPTTLQQEFQAAFGISIARYRREQALQIARDFLKQKMPMSEVAQKIGYNNTECFSKAFKKYFGRNPSEFYR